MGGVFGDVECMRFSSGWWDPYRTSSLLVFGCEAHRLFWDDLHSMPCTTTFPAFLEVFFLS